ncbi:hypothetical protein M2277_006331 [Paenibacillus sp. LBL]|nr:hypothetical protein [Paenibacillus sp. LBL]
MNDLKIFKTLLSEDKNIVTLEAADYAALYIYVIKFLSKHNDKNLITFPTDVIVKGVYHPFSVQEQFSVDLQQIQTAQSIPIPSP